MNDSSLQFEYPPIRWEWGPAQVRRYALAIGAPWSTLDDNDLTLVTGSAPTVFPTFAVLLADGHSLRHHPLPGIQYRKLDVIYAGHELEVFGALPSEGQGITRTRLVDVGDVSPGALVIRESISTNELGTVVARNVVTSIIRGASIGEPARRPSRSSAEPSVFDIEVEIPTLPQQALLYAQTGDDNPLHLNPSAARAAGFDRPILHGLCSYGMIAHAVMRECARARWTALRRVTARFTSPVVPGELLVARATRRGNEIEFAAWVRGESGAERKVLSHGEIELVDEVSTATI